MRGKPSPPLLSGGEGAIELHSFPAAEVPVIDTVEFGYMGPSVGDPERRAFRQAIPGGVRLRLVDSVEEDAPSLEQMQGLHPIFGSVTLKADGYLRVGGSLAKFRQRMFEDRPEEEVHNCEVLTAGQADETFQALTGLVERMFPFLDEKTLNLSRADVVYQRRVESSAAVLAVIEGAVMPTRLGCARFDNRQGVFTGLHLLGGVVSSRQYDKGLEAGKEEFVNVLRSEEQLRKKAAAFDRIYSQDRRAFDRNGCREVINARFLDMDFTGALDVAPLLSKRADTRALLILHPELLPAYKARVKKRAYYDMARKVREFRASAIPTDLRVPEWAWLQAA